MAAHYKPPPEPAQLQAHRLGQAIQAPPEPFANVKLALERTRISSPKRPLHAEATRACNQLLNSDDFKREIVERVARRIYEQLHQLG